MKLDDLHPFVLPYVPAVPLPTVEHHLRIAANDFFSRTNAWQEALDGFTTLATTDTYDLSLPTGTEIARVLSVLIDGDEYAKSVELTDGLNLTFKQSPPVGRAVAVVAALAPDVATVSQSWSIPDSLKTHRRDIALGALASLKYLSGDMGEGDHFTSAYANRVSTQALVVARSVTRARVGRPATAQFF